MKKKPIILAVLALLILIALLAGTKALQIGKMVDQGKAFVPPPETVTTASVSSESWETLLNAVGSLSAVQGLTVAAELPGKVTQIAFAAGATVRRGDLLLRQDTSTEEAQLPGAEAAVALTKANLDRAAQLLAQKFISGAEYDAAKAAHRQAQAQAAAIRATIAKKTIRAPFAGRLGVRLVNLGQHLREGDAIVSLQTLDPIFVDFSLPQQQLAQLRPGLPVRVSADVLPQPRGGTITALNPELDPATRSVRVQATLPNPGEELRPGMFVNIAVVLPARQQTLVIPATSVVYAPYSDSVFVVEEQKGADGGKDGLVLRQQFVHLGEKRGDFVAVLSGLKPGETVVSTGAFKLRNGQAVVVDNTLAPQFQLAPKPENQ